MRAFAISEFGQPGGLMELPDPVAGAGDILVRVHAASINPYDAVAATGATRAFAETRLPFIPGVDGAGVIAAVGEDVTGFAVGDSVIANAGGKAYWGGGTFAELVDVPASAAVLKPPAISFVDAAAIPQTGLTALGSIDVLDPQPGHSIAVIGATGGVGSWFTQIATDRGARVIALIRPDNFEYARSLGASESVDYMDPGAIDRLRQLDPDGLDGLADFSGNEELIEAVTALIKPGGRVSSSIASFDEEALAKRGITAARANKVPFKRMPELLDLFVAGRIQPVATNVVSFENLGEALAAAGAKQGRGKVVLQIVP